MGGAGSSPPRCIPRCRAPSHATAGLAGDLCLFVACLAMLPGRLAGAHALSAQCSVLWRSPWCAVQRVASAAAAMLLLQRARRPNPAVCGAAQGASPCPARHIPST
eukprot:scaffold8247_cov116-Isochrysis_galbana.AAC.11